MWQTTVEEIANGAHYRVHRDGDYLTFRELLGGLEADDSFANWYTEQLAACPFGACFWEHPALTGSNVDQPAEFVLLDAPSLAGVAADPRPFSPHFVSPVTAEPAAFPSLGGDAMLVAPGPGVGMEAGAHLLTFLRHGPRERVLQFWRLVARTLQEQLSASPRWLSTSGLGVYWLHVRVDSIPKYYQHSRYRSADLLGEC